MFNSDLLNMNTDIIISDADQMKKMEDEHLRLQRQVRMIQTDRLHRTMGVHPMFRSQDELLRTLKKEYINLKKDLKIARSGAQKKRDNKIKKNLLKEIITHEKTQLNCDGGLLIMEELEGLLDISTKQMLQLRKRAAEKQGALETRRFQSENRLISAKNQLEVATLRFNALQWENKKIREEIEHMLKDRALFKQSWDKMLSALSTGKKFLSDLFESSTLAYDQRDEWVAKLRSIQEKGKMDQMLQVQEMRDLKKLYDHEMKIYNFLAKKGIVRVNKKEEEKQEEARRKEEEDERRLYEEHLQIIDDIYEYTKEESPYKIIEDFKKREQENFSIYKLLTEFCAENVVLKRNLMSVRREIEDRHDYLEQSESKRKETLVTLQQELEEQEIRTQKLRSQVEDKDKILNGTMAKIQDIFKILDCSVEPFQNLLGDKQPSLHQLDLTLRLITDKIKEHIEVVYYFEHALKSRDKATTSRLKKFTVFVEPPDTFKPYPIQLLVPADPCPSCIETRWMSRVCESMEKPLEKDQVMSALAELEADPAYVRSDRVHALADCRATASRKLLATRHVY